MKNASVAQFPLLSKTILIFFAIVFLIMGIKLVLVEPFIGLANNGDFWRNMSEVGLWFCDRGTMTDCKIPYDEMYFGFTLNRYFYSVPKPSGFWTPYVLFLAISRWLAHLVSPSHFDIRFIGGLNLLLYWLGVITLISQIKLSKKLPTIIQIFLAISLVFFVSDSYILQYFNSFYAEPLSLISLIWFLALFLLIKNQKDKKTQYLLFLVQILFGIFSASAKQQDMLIIFPITAISVIELYNFVAPEIKGSRVISLVAGIILALSMIGPVFFIAEKNNGGDFMGEYNVIMNALLPYSSKQENLLMQLGFSRQQAKELLPFVGQTMFENNITNEYPDFFSRSGQIKIILSDPGMLVKSILDRSKSLFSDVTYGNFQIQANLPPYTKLGGYTRVWWNLIQILFPKSFFFYFITVFTSLLIGVIQQSKKLNTVSTPLLFLLGTSNIFRFAVALLGDGNEDAKHLFMTNIEFFVIFVLLVYYLALLSKRIYIKQFC